MSYIRYFNFLFILFIKYLYYVFLYMKRYSTLWNFLMMQRDMNIPYYETIYLVVKNRRFSAVYKLSGGKNEADGRRNCGQQAFASGKGKPGRLQSSKFICALCRRIFDLSPMPVRLRVLFRITQPI